MMPSRIKNRLRALIVVPLIFDPSPRWTLLGKPRNFVMKHAYWGKEFTEGEIADFLTSNNIPFRQAKKQPNSFECSTNMAALRMISLS